MNKDNKSIKLDNIDKKLHISDVIKRFFGIRKKLTYEERVQWFVNNFYETGMKYVNDNTLSIDETRQRIKQEYYQ